MTRSTFTAEVTESQAALLRRVLALSEELDDLALNAPDGVVFDSCENAVITGGRDLQRQLLQEAVARRVEAAEKKGAPIRECVCGRPKENRGPKTRQLVSAVGVVPIRRRYWQCRCGTTAGAYAVDAVLGLDGRYSRTLQKHACRLGADDSFATTREHLRELLGVRVSAETLRAMVEGHGKTMQRFQPQDEATAQAFRQASGEVEFAVDAGKVNTREEGWKDLKIAVIQKRESGRPAKPSEWETQRLPAASVVLAFAMIATSKVFRRSWRGRLRSLGVVSCASVHALGGGASWIWKSVQQVLTGRVQTLDFFHACEHLSRAAAGVFGEGTAAAKQAFERSRALLLERGWTGVCVWVSELLAVPSPEQRERRRRVTDRTVGYFSKHVGRLNYAERLASGRAIGSGTVEGQAKTLGLRLKRRGARWRKANVRPMASLVCVRHSSQWDAYWKTHTH